jgi:hypothetical protein
MLTFQQQMLTMREKTTQFLIFQQSYIFINKYCFFFS